MVIPVKIASDKQVDVIGKTISKFIWKCYGLC